MSPTKMPKKKATPPRKTTPGKMRTPASSPKDEVEMKSRGTTARKRSSQPFYETARFLDLYQPRVIELYRRSNEWPPECECGKPAAFTDIEEQRCLCLDCFREDEEVGERLPKHLDT